MLDESLQTEGGAQEAHWIPLSDLMTGLMVMFLLIAVMYMNRIEVERNKIREVAITYSELRDGLYEDLEKEFRSDLPKWKAELIKTDLSLRFTEPEVLFSTGSSELKPQFKMILADFFPRYVSILSSSKYRKSISEIRIEGHTSSAWTGAVTDEDAYYFNMDLSQARTRSALQYVLELTPVSGEKSWLKQLLTANGLSSSHLAVRTDGAEDAERSRRVEFRVRTDAETRIAKILDIAN
jgi:outer membrane protein OmpA-like peptidoglycan-associated protein